MTERELQPLLGTGSLRGGQQEDPLLEGIRSYPLHKDVRTDPDVMLIDNESDLLDDRELLWRAPAGKRKPVLAIHRASMPELISLFHMMHGHPIVASTLALLCELVTSSTMVGDVREYVLSCGCRRCKHSTSLRIAVLPSHTIQPWEVLEIHLVRTGVTSLTNNELLLRAVDKTSKSQFEFPLPSNKGEEVVRELLFIRLTFEVPHAIERDEDETSGAIAIQYLSRRLKADVHVTKCAPFPWFRS